MTCTDQSETELSAPDQSEVWGDRGDAPGDNKDEGNGDIVISITLLIALTFYERLELNQTKA